ncbi:transcriptional initiation protein Tat [Pseudomonas sp. GCM10022186]|uniref:transcriptional initiation protein Tat n=1 Tax=Pseudomonas sp. GCM10022186 TaxID=3252650 RepID=UPI00361C2A9D
MHDSSPMGTALSRRRFLSLSGQSALILGASAAASQLIPVTAIADDLLPQLPAGLLRMGRDIFPHDRLGDAPYAKPLFELAGKQPDLVRDGLKALQARARSVHGQAFEGIASEDDRVALLREIETTPFFRETRSALMFGLYDNETLFPLFGYEGSSVEKGGYIARGFNDLDWL